MVAPAAKQRTGDVQEMLSRMESRPAGTGTLRSIQVGPLRISENAVFVGVLLGPAVKAKPTATQLVADGHDTLSRLALMPPRGDGAVCWVQLLPARASMSVLVIVAPLGVS